MNQKKEKNVTQIEIFKGSDLYGQLLDSFSINEKIDSHLLDTNTISKTIYLNLVKMKLAGWRHRVNFKRKRKHTISEFFQDIIAFYLKALLPEDYEIELETKIGKTQPDIAIKKKGIYHFIIEIKTNIGWARPDNSQEDPHKEFRERVSELSKNFKVPTENIIYIFEDHGNVGKEFSEKFWDKKNQIPKTRPTDFPFSIIRPLFNGNDPYYWKHQKGFNRQTAYKEFNETEILNLAENNIVTKFEDIVKEILIANNNVN